MRTRYIKPGFFKNEELAELDPLHRILFAGLWCMADREGRLEYRPKRIKAEILPYDNCEIEAGLGALINSRFISWYGPEGSRVLVIHNFKKHQNPHKKEAKSLLPSQEVYRRETEEAPEIPVQAPDKPEQARPLDSNYDFNSNLEPITPTGLALSAPHSQVSALLETISRGHGMNGHGAVRKRPGHDYKPPDTPLQKFLLVVKQLQGFSLEDVSWDRVYFKRYARAAKDLLDFFGGDWKRAGQCASDIAHNMDDLARAWTVETILKLAPTWKSKHV